MVSSRVLILGNWNRIIFGLGCNITHLNSPRLRAAMWSKNQSFRFVSKACRDEMKTPGFSDHQTSDGDWSVLNPDIVRTCHIKDIREMSLGFSQKRDDRLKADAAFEDMGAGPGGVAGDPGSPGDWSVYNDHKLEYPSPTPACQSANIETRGQETIFKHANLN